MNDLISKLDTRIDVTHLHRFLAYRTELASLDVTVTDHPEASVADVSAHGETTRFNYSRNPLDTLREMLAHYPAPVTIDGEELPTKPFPHGPAVTIDYRPPLDHEGHRLHHRRDEAFPNVPGRSQIIIDGLTYSINPFVEPAYFIRPHQDDQHPLANSPVMHVVHYNINANGAMADTSRITLYTSHDRPLAVLLPHQAESLETEMARQREIAAAHCSNRRTPIRWLLTEEFHPPHHYYDRLLNPKPRPEYDNLPLHHLHAADNSPRPIMVLPHITPVAIDPQEQTSQANRASIARALLLNPQLGLIPVNPAYPTVHDQPPATLVCTDIVIVRHTLKPVAPLNHRITNGPPTPATSITATLELQDEHGTSVRTMDVNLDLLVRGEAHDYMVAYVPHPDLDTRTLGDLIHEFAWDHQADHYDEHDAARHRDDARILARRITEDDLSAFTAELQNLYRGFYPAVPAPDIPVVLEVNQHRYIHLNREANPQVPDFIHLLVREHFPNASPDQHRRMLHAAHRAYLDSNLPSAIRQLDHSS